MRRFAAGPSKERVGERTILVSSFVSGDHSMVSDTRECGLRCFDERTGVPARRPVQVRDRPYFNTFTRSRVTRPLGIKGSIASTRAATFSSSSTISTTTGRS